MPEQDIPINEIHDPSPSISSTSSATSSSRSSNRIQTPTLSDIEEPQELQRRYEFLAYDPIVIPREPSLDELLKQISGTNDIHNVTEISLRVVSHAISLQRISLFMPNLCKLNLEGSVVSSLRDLGCDNRLLKYLNVSNCGLKSLDGVNGLLSVEELIADYNQIQDVSQCCSMPCLAKLSLIRNNISLLDNMTFLELCTNLKELNLMENPVSEKNNYRNFIHKSIPQLKILDKIVFFESEYCTEFSSSEYQSSSTSPENSYNDRQILGNTNNIAKARPNSATITQHDMIVIDKNERNLRPSTSTGVYSSTSQELTSGKPYCGSIISVVRRKREKIAWADMQSGNNESSSSSGSESLSSNSSNKVFPIQLPQQAVELELGVIGVQQENRTGEENQTHQGLLEMARNWRNCSQRTRENIKNLENLRTVTESDEP